MANGPSHLQERFHFIAFFSSKMNIEFIPTDRVGKLYDQQTTKSWHLNTEMDPQTDYVWLERQFL